MLQNPTNFNLIKFIENISQVDSKIAKIIIDGNPDNKFIKFSVESKPDYHNQGVSSSYDWSSFFKITRRNNGDGIVRLKKSLEGAFQVDLIVG